MQTALQGLLSAVANIVSGLSPLAKAIVAAALPLASSVLNMVIAGSFNTTSIVVLATGAVSALAVFIVPNKAKAKAAPTPVAPVPTFPAKPSK